jgi:cytochrome c556
MKNLVRVFVLAAAGIGFGAALAVDTASAADAVQIRQSIMKEMSGHGKTIKKYLKGHKNPKKAARLATAGDVELRAGAMVGIANRLTSYFPKGTGAGEYAGKTRSKAKIWTDWAGFQAAAKKLAGAAGKLEAAAATGEKVKIKAAMKGIGKACGSCHKKFRVPKKKKTKKMKKAS